MKIYIPKRVESDFSFINNTFVEPGIYEAKLNPQGAVSVITKDGSSLGIKLDEFEFLSKEDRNAWINIAHPNIPEIKENDEIKSSEKFTNLGELLNFYLKKYNLGNQNKYSAIMELKKATCVFLQRLIKEAIKDRKVLEQKYESVYYDYCKDSSEIALFKRIKDDICEKNVMINTLEDLGKGILPNHDHNKKRLE